MGTDDQTPRSGGSVRTIHSWRRISVRCRSAGRCPGIVERASGTAPRYPGRRRPVVGVPRRAAGQRGRVHRAKPPCASPSAKARSGETLLGVDRHASRDGEMRHSLVAADPSVPESGHPAEPLGGRRVDEVADQVAIRSAEELGERTADCSRIADGERRPRRSLRPPSACGSERNPGARRPDPRESSARTETARTARADAPETPASADGPRPRGSDPHSTHRFVGARPGRYCPRPFPERWPATVFVSRRALARTGRPPLAGPNTRTRSGTSSKRRLTRGSCPSSGADPPSAASCLARSSRALSSPTGSGRRTRYCWHPCRPAVRPARSRTRRPARPNPHLGVVGPRPC